MSELYGAPSGIIASDENIRKNILSGLQAQETLGKIDQQPAEKVLKEAHARLYGAEAAQKELAAESERQMQALQAKFVAEKAARAKLVQERAARGEVATVENLNRDGSVVRSEADQLREFARFMEEQGAGPLKLAPINKTIAEISQKEAVTHYREAQAAEQRVKAQRERYELIGNTAGAAATNPQSYLALMADPERRAMLPPGLTGNYATDRPILKAIQDSSIKAVDRLNLARREIDDASKRALRGSTMAKHKVDMDVAETRKRLLNTRADLLLKNGGEGSPLSREARESVIRQRAVVAEAKFRKEFPAAPLDPKLREIGKNYVAADGKTLFTWTKDPTTGNPVAIRLPYDKSTVLGGMAKNPGATERVGPAAAAAADPDDDDDEELE